MGNLFGLVLGSYEGITPPIPVPGQRELPKVPWRESMSASWRVTAGKCRYWGNNFLVISGRLSNTVIIHSGLERDLTNACCFWSSHVLGTRVCGGEGARPPRPR